MEYYEIRDALAEHYKKQLARKKERMSRTGPLSPKHIQAFHNMLFAVEDALKHENYEERGTDEDTDKMIERLCVKTSWLRTPL